MESGLPHIAVVDDNQEIRELVGRYLGQHGFKVYAAENSAAFRLLHGQVTLDLVVLDIMMPGEDGLSLCRQLQASHPHLPVIFLTAMAEDTDRIVGLELGADDYLTKPFNPRELLARVRAVLRRVQVKSEVNDTAHEMSKTLNGLGANTASTQRVSFGDRMLDLSRQEVSGPDGIAVPLSSGEFKLLRVFLEHAGEVISREKLLDLTCGREPGLWDRSIDNQVSRLRRKIEPDPKNPALIKTHWGDGYCFTGKVVPG